ncbi:MAG: hypothetical protein D6719_00380, partial [Candidatus Dadabacteria bacterium]
MDPEIKEHSEGIHAFLVGQLALYQEDFDSALENFKKAAEKLKDSSPRLHARLADLYLKKGDLESAP